MKVILTTQAGQIAEERELTAVLRFPHLIMCNAFLYILLEVDGQTATYRYLEYYLLPPSPIEMTNDL
ncbi:MULTISPECIES: hypothetical protein [unclassified Nostoc]|uniref:hypothetical protein n=1 Tax=unclassified Nostoc TaxID=2593658 RepID=UPI001DDB05D3|nr:hypothetical protein [Nostoc sp. JL23]MBN3877951.1 hypothetical protein [Nostoc sp. JL23]